MSCTCGNNRQKIIFGTFIGLNILLCGIAFLNTFPDHHRKHLPFLSQRSDRTCTEQQKIAFLKVHKAGSTTVLNILERFGEKRSLLFALPKSYNTNYLGHLRTFLDEKVLIRLPKNKTYDILFNHVRYSKEKFHKVMPEGTRYIAIVREPLDLLRSAIEYLKLKFSQVKKIPGPDRVANFLKSPQKYQLDSKDPEMKSFGTFTRNSMAFDFGLDIPHFTNKDYIEKFVNRTLNEFDFIFVLEYFDECLVLFRRLLCWKLEDILYIPSNSNKNKITSSNYTLEEIETYRNWSYADYLLYDTLKANLEDTLSNQTKEFWKEVSVLKAVTQKLKQFCVIDKDQETLLIEKTEFSDDIIVNRKDCWLMTASEHDFLNYSRSRMNMQVKH